MGNYASCALCGPNADKKEREAAKVIFPGAEIQSFYEPITAAEMMLENPNSFLVNSKSLQMGRRFSPLNADEDLEMGNVYVLFLKHRLNSVVNAADMGALFFAAKRGSASSSSSSWGSQENSSSEFSVHHLNLEAIEEFCSSQTKYRLSLCRSRKPLLDTIVE